MRPTALLLATLAAILLGVIDAAAQGRPIQDLDFQKTNGPSGGDFRAGTVTPAGTIIVATVFGGVYRSENGGTTWEQAGANLPDARKVDLVSTPDGTVYLRMIEDQSTQPWKEGVHRSTDDGRTWSRIVEPRTLLGIIGTVDNDLYVHDDSGTYRSSDHGASWDTIPIRWAQFGVSGPDGAVYLEQGGSTNGVYILRSTDRGTTWDNYGDTIPGSIVGRPNFSEGRGLGVTHGGAVLYPSFELGMLRLDPATLKWAAAGVGLPPNNAWRTVIGIGPDTAFLAGDAGVYVSIDDGRTWRSVGDSTTVTEIAPLLVTENRDLIALSRNNVKRASLRQPVWETTSTGILEAITISMATDETGRVYVVGANPHLSDDGGQSWQAITTPLSPLESDWSVAAFGSDIVFIGTLGFESLNGSNALARAIVSTDRGLNWSDMAIGLSGSRIGRFRAIDGDVFALTDSGLFRASLGSLPGPWTNLTGNLPDRWVNDIQKAANGDYILATNRSGIWRSTNGGTTWQESNTGYLDSRAGALAMSPITGTLLAITNSGTHRSTDHGVSWSRLNSGDFNVGDRPNAVLFTPSGVAYMAGIDYTIAYHAVWISRDDGATFAVADTFVASLRTLSVDSAETLLYVGTQDDAVWRASISPSSVNDSPAPPLPLHFSAVHRDDVILVECQAAPGAEVAISVIGIDGRPVHPPVSISTLHGTIRTILPASHLPSGVYLVHCHDGRQQATQRILVTR